MSNFGIAAFFLASLPIGGMLGSWSRKFVTTTHSSNVVVDTKLDIQDIPPKLHEVFLRVGVPGIAAAFVVPLFLSVGQNEIISQILASDDILPILDDMLVVFGFCILAGATASNFIDSMAARALEVSDQNRKSISSIKQENNVQSDLIAEIIENKGQRVESSTESLNYDPKILNAKENSVMSALRNDEYVRRSITGISKETAISIPELRSILAGLARKGLVKDYISNRTGSILYQAIL
ncbi:YEATS-associated helix-containing protein [Mesorhizobium neociceri]|uniref:YEATS-Like-Associating Three TM domain-containing protein n=1 Tax=Mesorhizobium neociceri TaxID=1307853 RepID=A0A838B3N6_9HYPH|nr:YEATS-associated helix-containing protein [Mesorhizobium neociceri]MBA1140394.1 hypothetical protein [Mesorhizobium neociceri]